MKDLQILAFMFCHEETSFLLVVNQGNAVITTGFIKPNEARDMISDSCNITASIRMLKSLVQKCMFSETYISEREI